MKNTSRIKRYLVRKLVHTRIRLFGPLCSVVHLSFVKLETMLLKKVPDENVQLDLAICVPVGPGELLGILDLVESARCYLDGTYRIVVVDDSGGLSIWWKLRRYPEVDYLRNFCPWGFPGLFATLQKAYRHALEHYRFPFLLKIDADALITGFGLIEDIRNYIAANPNVGILGSYRITSAGTRREFSSLGAALRENWDHWSHAIETAQRNGYELGEHVQGGAYVVSLRCLSDMKQSGYLTRRPTGTFLAEDALFSLYSRSLGYELHDFAKYGQPFAIAWRGLPISKEEIVRQNKKVIHSLKYGEDDINIRNYFRDLRRTALATEGS